ncbi:ODA2 [Symbiodinium sp. CCMP2592]|nr:ODA2 [Symbiodinium sp. CCMP2592]
MDLESSLRQFINHSFEAIASIDSSLKLLTKFQAILQRDSLRQDLENKFAVIFHNYGLELTHVQDQYEKYKTGPPLVRNLPPVAGHITWSRHLYRRIEGPMQKFNTNPADGELNVEAVGSLSELFTSILTMDHGSLEDLRVWRSIMRGWQQPHMQHDISEFAEHALRRLRPETLQGSWSARREDPVIRVLDCGDLWSPITLAIPPRATDLQECIQNWHGQSTIHALEGEAPVVMFQLGRFHDTASTVITKNCQSLKLLPQALLPVFSGGLRTRWHAYTLSACIFHIGQSPHSGHYRAVLMGYAVPGISDGMTDAGTGDAGGTTHQYVTDDDCSAIEVTPELQTLCEQNSYLLFYVRSAE